MNHVMPALDVMWTLLKFGVPFILFLALLKWGMNWVESKVTPSRPTRERKPRRTRKEIRAERGRLAREKGLAFEAELKGLFEAAGWQVETTPLSGDQGVDLIVRYTSRRYAIQAKDHQGKVGPNAVDAIYAGKAAHECDGAILIASGGVTDLARSKADKLGVAIWTDLTKLKAAAAGELPVR